MNDLLGYLYENPWSYGFHYTAIGLWVLFCVMIFLKTIHQTSRVWADFKWWAQIQDGMDVRTKRVVSDYRFKIAARLAVGSCFLMMSAVMQMFALLFGSIPKPEVALERSGITLVLLGFFFCTYVALRQNDKLNEHLKGVEHELQVEQIHEREAAEEGESC